MYQTVRAGKKRATLWALWDIVKKKTANQNCFTASKNLPQNNKNINLTCSQTDTTKVHISTLFCILWMLVIVYIFTDLHFLKRSSCRHLSFLQDKIIRQNCPLKPQIHAPVRPAGTFAGGEQRWNQGASHCISGADKNLAQSHSATLSAYHKLAKQAWLTNMCKGFKCSALSLLMA